MIDNTSEEEPRPKTLVEELIEQGDEENNEYYSTAFIPPTSVAIESLFSRAGHIWTNRRATTLPFHVEEAMFLMVNMSHWDIFTVQRILSKQSDKDIFELDK